MAEKTCIVELGDFIAWQRSKKDTGKRWKTNADAAFEYLEDNGYKPYGISEATSYKEHGIVYLRMVYNISEIKTPNGTIVGGDAYNEIIVNEVLRRVEERMKWNGE